MKRKLFRLVSAHLLVTTLVFQLAVGTSFYALASDDKKESNPMAEELRRQAATPEVRAEIIKGEKVATAIEEGKITSLPREQFDAFNLAGQKLVIPTDNIDKPDVRDLSRLNDKLPAIAFSKLEIDSDPGMKELRINAISGGKIIAQHVIPNITVHAHAAGNEIVVLVDAKNGKIHAMDMGYVKLMAFRNPLPIFKNLANIDIAPDRIPSLKATFLTRGLKPFAEVQAAENDPGVVVPRDDKGQPILKAGDLVVYSNDGKSRDLEGIYSRSITYSEIRKGTSILAWMAYIVSPSSVSPKVLNGLIKLLEKEGIVSDADREAGRLSPEVQTALLSVDNVNFQHIMARAEAQAELEGREFDKFLFKEWVEDYEELERQAEEQIAIQRKSNKKRLRDRLLGRFTRGDTIEGSAKVQKLVEEEKLTLQDGDALEADELEKQVAEEDLGEASKGLTVVNNNDVKRLTVARVLKSNPMKLLAAIAAGSTAGYMFNFGSSTEELILILNHAYENWVPTVLKTEWYNRPLLYSMMSLMAIIPLVQYMAKTSVPVVGKVAGFLRKTGDVLSKPFGGNLAERFKKRADKLDDGAKNWKGLKTWRRITSAGLRAYYVLMLPFWNWVVPKVLRQPHLLDSGERWVNPFKKVLPNSSLGLAAGVTAPTRVGVNSPLPAITGKRKEKKAETRKNQQKIFSAIARQKKRVDVWSSTLAFMVVGEKHGIDVATLAMMAQGQATDGEVKVTELKKLAGDAEKIKEWEALTQAIKEELRSIDGAGLESEIDPKQFAEYVRIAKETAQKLETHGDAGLIKKLRKKFRDTTKASVHQLITFGREDAEFLRTQFTNDFVSDQVKKEFVIDHAMVVILIGLWGERADVTKPVELAADPNGDWTNLWTNGRHAYDIVTNTMAHFFIAGARTALVYQGTPNLVDDIYRPTENFDLNGKPKQEGFFRGLGRWFRDVLWIPKSDLGHYFFKSFKKRFTTLQASIVMALVFRWAFGGQVPSVALKAWYLSWIAAPLFYGWVWTPVQRGNQIESQTFEARNKRLIEAKTNINQGVRLSDEAKVEKGLESIYEQYAESSLDTWKRVKKATTEAEKFLKIPRKQRSGKEIGKTLVAGNKSAARYVGLVAELGRALDSKPEPRAKGMSRSEYKEVKKKHAVEKHNRVSVAYGALLGVYSNESGEVPAALKNLNANFLLEYSLENPPVFTDPSPYTSWLSVWGGAVGSTLLAVPLMVMSFHNDALEFQNLAKWTAYAAAAYVGALTLTTKKGWETIGKVLKAPFKKLRGSKKAANCEKQLTGKSSE